MKVVELHPEDLIDKLTAGELSRAERERLNAHLAQCNVCRFELGVRAELDLEMPVCEPRPQLGVPTVSERLRAPGDSARLPVSIRARSRRRWPLVMLAAALVLCAGGATAAVMSGALPARWLPWVPETKPALSVAPAESAKVSSKGKRVPGKPPAVAEREPEPIASAEPSAVTLPSTSAEASPSAEPAKVSAAAPPMNRSAIASAALVAAKNTDSAANVGLATATATAMASANSAAPEAASAQVEDAPPRLDPAAALFADANRARRDGNADRAVSLYRALQSRYPSSRESDVSRALLAQLLLDRGNPEAALAGFERYLAEAAPVLSAEALVGRARALEQLGKSTEAVAAWRDVQSRFPGSVHARLAATRLAALGMR